MATQFAFGKIVTNGLALSLDAADKNSYPGSGTTWRDLSENGYNGALTNGPTFNTDNGGSIVFDGIDDKVTFPAAVGVFINTANGVTIEIWFKTSSQTKYQDIFDTADAAGGIWMVTNFSGAGTGKIVTSFNTTTGYISSDYVANRWYQVVLAGVTGDNKQYINGILTGTATQNVTSYINLEGTRIGNVDNDRASEYLIGNVASFKIYNRMLSASEIQQNYNAQKSRFNL